MESYFSLPNNTKYLVILEILINLFILSNLIRKGLESINYCTKCYKPKNFCTIFHILKYFQNQDL